MSQSTTEMEAEKIAAEIFAEIKQSPVRNTASLRAVRQKYSHALREASGELVLQLSAKLCSMDEYRWIGYELIRGHREAFKSIGPEELEELGRGINSWWTADAFARTLSGPAWLHRQVPDE